MAKIRYGTKIDKARPDVDKPFSVKVVLTISEDNKSIQWYAEIDDGFAGNEGDKNGS